MRKWMGVEVEFGEHLSAFAYALPEVPGLLRGPDYFFVAPPLLEGGYLRSVGFHPVGGAIVTLQRFTPLGAGDSTDDVFARAALHFEVT